MKPEVLAELERLLAKATPGPWKTCGLSVMADTGGDSDVANATFVAQGAGPLTFDIDLICHMQRALPALIAAAHELAELKSALDFLCAESDALITVSDGNGDADSVCTEAAAVLGFAKRLGWKGSMQ